MELNRVGQWLLRQVGAEDGRTPGLFRQQSRGLDAGNA